MRQFDTLIAQTSTGQRVDASEQLSKLGRRIVRTIVPDGPSVEQRAAAARYVLPDEGHPSIVTVAGLAIRGAGRAVAIA